MPTTQYNLPEVNREFVTVPETVLPNGTIVPEFKVGKYITGREGDQLVINATSQPWVLISFLDAQAEAKKAGLALITELQYLALAHNIASVAVNWTSGVVGEGCLFQGLRKATVEQVQPGSYEPEDEDERRWFELSNGERIWDASGNAYSWVFDNIHGDESGIIAKQFYSDSPSINSAPATSVEKGVGWYPECGDEWSGDVLVRGGCLNAGGGAGIFCLLNGTPSNEYGFIGFRCTLP